MSDFLPKTERRSIRYDFSAVETHDLSLTLASKTKELQAVKEEKKTVVSQYGTKEKEIQGILNRLSNQVADGWEFRDTLLNIEYHKPEQGKKTLTNPDNGKFLVEKMSDYEWNLFNQPKDDDLTGEGEGGKVVPLGKKGKGGKKSKQEKVEKPAKIAANGGPRKSRKKLGDIAAEVKAAAGIVVDEDPLGLNDNQQGQSF